MSTQETASQATRERDRQWGLAKKAPLLKTVRSGKYGLPQQTVQRFKYCEVLGLSIVSGAATYVIRANDLFDPNSTGAGHQPYGFDQWMTFYNHFVVTKSYLRVSFPSGLAADYVIVASTDDDGSTSLDVNRQIEKTNSRMVCGTPSAAQIPPLQLGWKSSDYFGKDVMANTELHGTSSASPTEQTNYIISWYDRAGATNTMTVVIQVWYEAILFELKDFSGS